MNDWQQWLYARSLLARCAIGESAWIETTAEGATQLQRYATRSGKFPAHMADMRFSVRMFTAVGHMRIGDVALVAKITRKQ